MAATFLRHEGFLGAVGAFLKVHPLTLPVGSKGEAGSSKPTKVGPESAGQGRKEQDSVDSWHSSISLNPYPSTPQNPEPQP